MQKKTFKKLKTYFSTPLLLSKPLCGELFYLYLVVFTTFMSSALVIEKDRVQLPIDYTSYSMVIAGA